jgi:hypothetical protein
MTWLTLEETIGCLLLLEWAIIASTAVEWEDFCTNYFPAMNGQKVGLKSIDSRSTGINPHPKQPQRLKPVESPFGRHG